MNILNWLKYCGALVALSLYLGGVAYAGDIPSVYEHADLMVWLIVGLGGLFYAGGGFLISKGIAMLLDHEKRLTKLETRCEDQHKDT